MMAQPNERVERSLLTTFRAKLATVAVEIAREANERISLVPSCPSSTAASGSAFEAAPGRLPAFDLSATRPARKSAATRLAVSASFSVPIAAAARVVSAGDLLFPVDFLRGRLVFDAAASSPRAATIFASTKLALEFGAPGRIACADADRRIAFPDSAVESAAPRISRKAGGGHDEKISRMTLVEGAHRRYMAGGVLGVRKGRRREGHPGFEMRPRERGMRPSVPQVCVGNVCAA